jgi:hypothetical protein
MCTIEVTQGGFTEEFHAGCKQIESCDWATIPDREGSPNYGNPNVGHSMWGDKNTILGRFISYIEFQKSKRIPMRDL